jgi:predicted MPP superfamily phosphohydrolase
LTVKEFERTNYISLNNNSSWVKQGIVKIKIGGVDDYWTGSQNLNKTTNDLSPQDFAILVSHNPDYIEQIDTSKLDLVLCGHTHGGQVSLFGKWAPWIPSQYGQKYAHGLKRKGDTQIIISKGIGTVILPLRLFARPEIVQITLKNK